MVVTLEKLTLRNGSVTYSNEVEPRPETTETSEQDGVTVHIHNAELVGAKAHYIVKFDIEAEYTTDDGLKVSNGLYWNCVVREQSDRAEYRVIEDRAAREIAPMLRALADKIEADVAEAESRVQ